VQGRDAFRKQGIALAVTGMHGSADALQAVLNGGADIATGVDPTMALRAFGKGALLRILLPSFTGASDLYWYVKTDSAITNFAGASAENTIAYSTIGSPTHLVVTELARELKIKAKPATTGSPAATLVDVMSGRADIGWGRWPFGLKEIAEEKIRVIAQGADIASFKARTMRVIVVRAETLQTKKDALARFARGYRDAVDWLYSEPRAIKAYAEAVHLPADAVETLIRRSFPKSAMQSETVSGLEETMREAVKHKNLDAPLTKEQIAALLAVPPK